MKVVFKIQNISFEKKENVIVRLYGRTVDGKKVCDFDYFQDYFLIDVTNVKNTDKIKDLCIRYEKFDGKLQNVP